MLYHGYYGVNYIAQCKLGMAYFINLVIGLTQIISICNINDVYNNLL